MISLAVEEEKKGIFVCSLNIGYSLSRRLLDLRY